MVLKGLKRVAEATEDEESAAAKVMKSRRYKTLMSTI